MILFKVSRLSLPSSTVRTSLTSNKIVKVSDVFSFWAHQLQSYQIYLEHSHMHCPLWKGFCKFFFFTLSPNPSLLKKTHCDSRSLSKFSNLFMNFERIFYNFLIFLVQILFFAFSDEPFLQNFHKDHGEIVILYRQLLDILSFIYISLRVLSFF